MKWVLLQKAKVIKERHGKTDHRSDSRLCEVHPEEDRQWAGIGYLSPIAQLWTGMWLATAAKNSLQFGPSASHCRRNSSVDLAVASPRRRQQSRASDGHSRTPTHAEFSEQSLDVDLHGPLAQLKITCDLLV
jgi:hypothetical protein